MRIKKIVFSLVVIAATLFLLKAHFFLNSTFKPEKFKLPKLFTHFKRNIPADINFAGDPIPISNFKVRELLDKELNKITYAKTGTLLLHKNSARWFKTIEPILEKYEVPNDFKYVALAESQFSNSVSKKGAAGFWQFMKHSGKDKNLIINDEIDERLSIEKSTIAACAFFKNVYKKTGSWTLAAAAFNMGFEGLQKKMNDQNTTNYYDLALNLETSRYVFKLLALKEIITRPAEYGYRINPNLLYPHIPTKKIKLPVGYFNLKDFAKEKAIDYHVLQVFNPWILKENIIVTDSLPLYIDIPNKGLSTNFIKKLIEQDSTTAARLSKGRDSL